MSFDLLYPANLQPVLPQFELLGHAWTLSPLFFMYAGADLYKVSISVEPHSGHGMRFSVFSAIVALISDSLLHLVQRKS